MSKMKMQAIVKAVEPRIIKQGQPDQRTIYDVVDDSGQKWTAWDIDIAKQAHELKDKPSVWDVETKPSNNPKYGPNRTLLGIGPVGDAAMNTAIDTFASDFTFGGSGTSGNGSGTFTTTSPATSNVTFDPPGSVLTAKDTSIHRQTAVKAVAVLAQNGGMSALDFWQNVEHIVRFFETGDTPMTVRPEPVQPLGGDPGPIQDFPPATDDDIPF